MAEDSYFIPGKELIDLAVSFSEGYKTLKPGTYKSSNGRYQIEYVDVFKDDKEFLFNYEGIMVGPNPNFGKELTVPARVNNTTGVIGFSKKLFSHEAYTPDYVFYMVIWCAIGKQMKDAYRVDEIALQEYHKTGRSKKNLVKGYGQMFILSPSTENNRRYQNIIKTLDTFQ